MRSASSRAIARPEAGAAGVVAGVEALEDLGARPGWMPGPVVGHRELAVPVVPRAR